LSLYCELSNEENIKEFLKEAFIMKNRNEELKRKIKEYKDEEKESKKEEGVK
jgi:hypothetical protein